MLLPLMLVAIYIFNKHTHIHTLALKLTHTRAHARIQTFAHIKMHAHIHTHLYVTIILFNDNFYSLCYQRTYMCKYKVLFLMQYLVRHFQSIFWCINILTLIKSFRCVVQIELYFLRKFLFEKLLLIVLAFFVFWSCIN